MASTYLPKFDPVSVCVCVCVCGLSRQWNGSRSRTNGKISVGFNINCERLRRSVGCAPTRARARSIRELTASRSTPCSLPTRAMWAQKNRCAISFALLKTIKSHQYGKVTTWQSVNWHSPFPGEEFRLMVTLTVDSNVTLDRLRRSAGCAPVRCSLRTWRFVGQTKINLLNCFKFSNILT